MDDVLPGPRLPSWVRLENGSLVPFDPDTTQKWIFAALARCGHPDAFLCRELTDSVHHFLADRVDPGTVGHARLEEVVIQILRELGHARLAAAIQIAGPGEVRAGVDRAALLAMGDAAARRIAVGNLRRFAADRVFSPQVMALVDEGLLHLSALRQPHQVAARVRHPLAPTPTFAAPWSDELGTCLDGLDSPEHALALAGDSAGTVGEYLTRLAAAAAAAGRWVSLHVNAAPAPPWAETDFRPLFPPPPRWATHVEDLREQLVAGGAAVPPEAPLRWTLHLQGAMLPSWGRHLAALLRQRGTLDLVWDRPRQPVRLDMGLTRRRWAKLQTIDLDLDRLWQCGGPWELDPWIGRLLLLLRMAVTAGVQHREFLRRLAPPQPDFVLEHASVQLRLRGLAAVARHFFPSKSGLAAVLKFVAHLMERLEPLLRREAALHGLPAVVTWSWPVDPDHLAEDLDLSGRLQACLGDGRACLRWPRAVPLALSWEEVVRTAGRCVNLNRLRLVLAKGPGQAGTRP